ncbi:MAG: tail fiber domain-containing protein, partial [Kiritimatiellae bacterium]|nr:tail fiber domain-containing protein [Kiritimatiellia bacterium]
KGQGMPAGFADDVDNVGITAETDPTVVGWVKDGESWAELKGQGMPAGFADDVDNMGITEETDPQVGAIAPNSVPRWDNEKLVTSGIYYDPVNGNVGIGTASPDPRAKLDVNGEVAIWGNLFLRGSGAWWIGAYVQDVWPSAQNPYLCFHQGEPGEAEDKYTTVLLPSPGGFYVLNPDPDNPLPPDMYVGYIEGYVQARGGFITLSDDRIKLNEQTLEYGLAQVMALEPKRYDRANCGYDPETEELIIYPEKTINEIGLVAQDVQKVIPEAVRVPEDENRQLWSLSYDTMVPVLVKAIQEQQAQIEALKPENQALKSGPLTADFDGDGKTDTAIVDAKGQWYVWLSNSGYIKTGPYNFGVTGKPMVGDFDGDGKADPGMVDLSGNWYVWLSASGYSMSGPHALGI